MTDFLYLIVTLKIILKTFRVFWLAQKITIFHVGAVVPDLWWQWEDSMILMVVVVAANVVMALLVSTQGRGDQHFLPLLPCFLLAFVFCHTKQQKM